MPTPPGPRSRIPFRYLRTLQRDPIPFFSRLATEYGDASQFHVGPQQIVFFNHPDLIRELLVTQHRSFHKSRVLQRSKIIFGEGLLTSEEEVHRKQRRLVQPAFHRERIARYAEVMIERAARLAWRNGQMLDAGPRICIGEGFAWMESVLMVAKIAQRWKLSLEASEVAPQASITLRPNGGVRMR